MGDNVALCYKNILEISTVTLATGTEDPTYPLYRTYDRDVGLQFRPTAAVTTTIKIDQGSAPIAIDRLIVPAYHNLSGVGLSWKASDADSGYADVLASWTQGDNLLINKSAAASLTHRYQKFTIASPSAIPYISELFIGATYEFEVNPVLPKGAYEPLFNVDRSERFDGKPRYWVKGSARRQRHYNVKNADPVQSANFMTFYAAWAGSKPFWLRDDTGIWIFGELTAVADMQDDEFGTSFSLSFLEVLP